MSKIFFVLVLCAIALPDNVPFWRSKPEIYRKMKEDRYIAVSAKTSKIGSEKKLSVVAAGIIHAPLSFTDDRIHEYDSYPKFLSYVIESSFDKKTNNIVLHGAILGYHVHMTIHEVSKKVPKGREMDWTCIDGNFKGMEGVILENETDHEHTEISLDSHYKAKELGIPAPILNWALEVAAQRTAAAMRSHVESEWENSKKH